MKIYMGMKEKRGESTKLSPVFSLITILVVVVAAGIILNFLLSSSKQLKQLEVEGCPVTYTLDSFASCLSAVGTDGCQILEISIDRSKSKSDDAEILRWNVVIEGTNGTSLRQIGNDAFQVPLGFQKIFGMRLCGKDLTELGEISTLEAYPIVVLNEEVHICNQNSQKIELLECE